MSHEKGFVSIFNGWEGLVENLVARGRMSKKALARAKEKANKQMMADWFIKDEIIGFKGEGYDNISAIKDYGDFETLVFIVILCCSLKKPHYHDSGAF